MMASQTWYLMALSKSKKRRRGVALFFVCEEVFERDMESRRRKDEGAVEENEAKEKRGKRKEGRQRRTRDARRRG
jgi:hypothetical protein